MTLQFQEMHRVSKTMQPVRSLSVLYAHTQCVVFMDYACIHTESQQKYKNSPPLFLKCLFVILL